MILKEDKHTGLLHMHVFMYYNEHWLIWDETLLIKTNTQYVGRKGQTWKKKTKRRHYRHPAEDPWFSDRNSHGLVCFYCTENPLSVPRRTSTFEIR